VPGLVKRVGDRPTGSSKKPKPPPGGTNPSTRKSKAKEELKHNQKQKYQPIDQNFKLTKNNKHYHKRQDLSCGVNHCEFRVTP